MRFVARSARRLAIAGIVVCLATASLVCVAARPPAAGAAPLGPQVGVTAGWMVTWESDAERNAELDFIAASGAKWFGMDLNWASIQPKRGQWNWGPTDKVVLAARARGLTIIGMLGYSPRWAVPDSCPAGTTHCLPARTEDYARFAKQAALRYGNNSSNIWLRGSITAWQIWNEPNHYPFVQPVVDLLAYTIMLKQSYVAIKSVDFWTTVLAGGTSPAPDDPSGRDVAPATFLAGIYYLGGGGHFDAFAHHPYSFPCGPLVEAPWNAFGQTAAIYYTMAVSGDAHKKVWGTETGSPTGDPVGWCGPNSPGQSVPEAVQAWYVHEYLWGWTEKFKAFTGPLIFHQIRDNGLNRADVDDNFGLLRRDFSQKPSYQVFAAMMRG